MAQTIVRSLRYGQKKEIHIYHVVAQRSIDVDGLAHETKQVFMDIEVSTKKFTSMINFSEGFEQEDDDLWGTQAARSKPRAILQFCPLIVFTFSFMTYPIVIFFMCTMNVFYVSKVYGVISMIPSIEHNASMFPTPTPMPLWL
jgi:hypothetical protein